MKRILFLIGFLFSANIAKADTQYDFPLGGFAVVTATGVVTVTVQDYVTQIFNVTSQPALLVSDGAVSKVGPMVDEGISLGENCGSEPPAFIGGFHSGVVALTEGTNECTVNFPFRCPNEGGASCSAYTNTEDDITISTQGNSVTFSFSPTLGESFAFQCVCQ